MGRVFSEQRPHLFSEHLCGALLEASQSTPYCSIFIWRKRMKKYTLTRRQFLKQAAAFTAATALPLEALAHPATLLAARPAAGSCARRTQGRVPDPGEPIRDCSTGR